ncbi:hypothetical protein AJO04nite_00700 [Acinetobacter johnsonii]|uniref:RelA/SpoT domain-containing protein n=1 Tax=Acinetobacter johnsonii TaxID=40214 RepID=A0AAV3WAN0_ACIJO|nr:RelA/SpoT domain-containing protein [Acinetobacter johnsonii]GEK42812.1 hypothetical protein AJO04nite_00700 [Acinetobacter johnsonii]
MNESEFLVKWKSEKPTYEAWGRFIVQEIDAALKAKNLNLNKFIKIPVIPRTKDETSLIDKAFYRNKNYKNPYDDIEDKIGLRYVVLLTEDIKVISHVIKSNNNWDFVSARDYEDERDKDPYLFTYQSVHFVLRPKKEIEFEGSVIALNTPCEIQVRTLLQHAHAELTHDEIYKSNRDPRSEVHRAVAKSMALIEATDEIFCKSKELMNSGPLTEFKVIESLDSIYKNKVGLEPQNQKSSLLRYQAFEDLISEELIKNISELILKYGFLPSKISQKYHTRSFYQQSVILFVYWLLKNNKQRLLKDWPLEHQYLERLGVDVGESINFY